MNAFLDDYHIDIQRQRGFAPRPVWEWRVLHRWTGRYHGEGRSEAGFARACGDAMMILIGQVETPTACRADIIPTAIDFASSPLASATARRRLCGEPCGV